MTLSAESRLHMWVVYDHPLDHPNGFIARRWIADPRGPRATTNVLTGTSLQAVRDQLPVGLHRLRRDPTDDPAIVEIWC